MNKHVDAHELHAAIAQPAVPARKRKTLFLALAGGVALVGAGFWTYQTTVAAYPTLAEQLSVRGRGITMVYDRHGEPLGALTNPNSAIAEPVPLEEVSPTARPTDFPSS